MIYCVCFFRFDTKLHTYIHWTRVQSLDEAFCISFHINILWKGVVYSYADACITRHNKDERHSSLEKYTSHFIERVVCERELETEQNCNILTPTLLAITAFLSRSPGLLNRGPGGQASLSAGFLYRILFPIRLIPNWLIGGLRTPSAGCCLFLPHLVSNWLNFLRTELYKSSTPEFFLWASQIALIQPIHGQGYTLLFLGRMHLLFTLVHFLFWRPGRVVGQYTTKVWIQRFSL